MQYRNTSGRKPTGWALRVHDPVEGRHPHTPNPIGPIKSNAASSKSARIESSSSRVTAPFSTSPSIWGAPSDRLQDRPKGSSPPLPRTTSPAAPMCAKPRPLTRASMRRPNLRSTISADRSASTNAWNERSNAAAPGYWASTAPKVLKSKSSIKSQPPGRTAAAMRPNATSAWGRCMSRERQSTRSYRSDSRSWVSMLCSRTWTVLGSFARLKKAGFMSAATTWPDEPTRSASQWAIDPRPAPISIHRHPDLTRIHRRTALGTALEARGCPLNRDNDFGTETRPETRSTH